jgi:hypothetical protein
MKLKIFILRTSALVKAYSLVYRLYDLAEKFRATLTPEGADEGIGRWLCNCKYEKTIQNIDGKTLREKAA